MLLRSTPRPKIFYQLVRPPDETDEVAVPNLPTGEVTEKLKLQAPINGNAAASLLKGLLKLPGPSRKINEPQNATFAAEGKADL